MTAGYTWCRYIAAALLLLYGFAKLTGAQFTTLDSELDRPLGEVSGFWLTWYYFGYSRVYGSFLALVQIGGAIALMIPRLALIGACVLFGVMGNIILIDVFYGVGISPLLTAIVIEGCLARVLFDHRDRLLQLILPRTEEKRPAAAWAFRAFLVAAAFGTTYYVANYNNIVPTPIDGTWVVTNPGNRPELPTRVYFERNRAFWCVFQYKDRFADHHFLVNPAQRSVRIWTAWMQKGPLLMEGTYDVAAGTMLLHGRLDPATPTRVTLSLTRLRGPRTAR